MYTQEAILIFFFFFFIIVTRVCKRNRKPLEGGGFFLKEDLRVTLYVTDFQMNLVKCFNECSYSFIFKWTKVSKVSSKHASCICVEERVVG